MSGEEFSGGPLDVATLEVLARRAASHPHVGTWTFRPEAISPRRLELDLDDRGYPPSVGTARLDVRWYEGGHYAFHYLERRDGDAWQCRWDRHPKPGAPDEHFHPPPDAGPAVEPSALEATHHLGALFGVLDWIAERVEQLHHDRS